MTTHIRWFIRRDLPAVLAIEEASNAQPWTDEAFIHALRNKDCIGMTADRDDEIVGFMIYKLRQDSLQLLNLAVHPDFRRQGIGRQMIDKLLEKLTPQRRKRLVAIVRESQLDGQLFLRACGLRAIDVERSFFPDTLEDAYRFQIHVKRLAECNGV